MRDGPSNDGCGLGLWDPSCWWRISLRCSQRDHARACTCARNLTTHPLGDADAPWGIWWSHVDAPRRGRQSFHQGLPTCRFLMCYNLRQRVCLGHWLAWEKWRVIASLTWALYHPETPATKLHASVYVNFPHSVSNVHNEFYSCELSSNELYSKFFVRPLQSKRKGARRKQQLLMIRPQLLILKICSRWTLSCYHRRWHEYSNSSAKYIVHGDATFSTRSKFMCFWFLLVNEPRYTESITSSWMGAMCG